MMATFAMILQLVNACLLVVLMAVQTEKVEQGGVMGIGATGGRQTGGVDLLVGGERILKPLTRWAAALETVAATKSMARSAPQRTWLEFNMLKILKNWIWASRTNAIIEQNG